MTQRISRLVSFLFSPLIIPTYGMIAALWATWLSAIPVANRCLICLVVFLFTCMMPFLAIFILMRMGMVKSIAMTDHRERNYPYVIVIFSYIGCAIYLAVANAPLWLVMFLGGAAVAATLSAIINIWWKISIHSAAIAGLVALLFRIHASSLNCIDMLPVISVGVIAMGIVATARLALERHTLQQITAGAVNGFLWVYLLTAL